MRTVPQRFFGVQVLVLFGGFLAGPLLGICLGGWAAPESEVVQTVGFFAFGLVFFLGTVSWMGLGVVTVVVSGLWRLLRGKRPGPEGLSASDQLVPAGYGAYAALGVVGGLLCGLVAGLLTEAGLLGAVGLWTGAGAAYGVALSLAAHHGWLPFPEPDFR